MQRQLIRIGNQSTFAVVQFFEMSRRSHQTGYYGEVLVPTNSVSTVGLDHYYAVSASGGLYLLPGTPICDLFMNHASAIDSLDGVIRELIFLEALGSVGEISLWNIGRFFTHLENQDVPKPWLLCREELEAAIGAMEKRLKVYDPLSWGRRESDAQVELEF
jgi:hypothetical protein